MSSKTDYAVWLERYDTKDGAVERVISNRGFTKTDTLANIGNDHRKLMKEDLQNNNVAQSLILQFLQDTQAAADENDKQWVTEVKNYSKAKGAAQEAKKIS